MKPHLNSIVLHLIAHTHEYQSPAWFLCLLLLFSELIFTSVGNVLQSIEPKGTAGSLAEECARQAADLRVETYRLCVTILTKVLRTISGTAFH